MQRNWTTSDTQKNTPKQPNQPNTKYEVRFWKYNFKKRSFNSIATGFNQLTCNGHPNSFGCYLKQANMPKSQQPNNKIQFTILDFGFTIYDLIILNFDINKPTTQTPNLPTHPTSQSPVDLYVFNLALATSTTFLAKAKYQ